MVIKKFLFITFAGFIIALTVIGAVQPVSAFRLGNYDVGFDGIKKTERNSFKEQKQGDEEHGQVSSQQIVELIRTTNQDKEASLFLKSAFAGNNFCVVSEERVAYVSILDDGSAKLLDTKPRNCYVIRTTEREAMHLYNKYVNKEEIRYRDIKQTFDIPYRVRLKAAVGNVLS